MQRFTITLALLAACSDELPTDDLAQAQGSTSWSLADQKAAVAARDARRAAQRIPDLRKQTKPADWIAHAYHGLVLDANYDEIVLDDATLGTIQQSVFDTIYPATAAAAKKKYGTDLATLYNQPLQGVEQRIVRAAALYGLIEVADPALSARYAGVVDTLRGATTRQMEQNQYQISPTVAAMVQQAGVGPWLAPPAPGADYIATCRARQVPIPPDWPDDRWIRQGALEFTFISLDLDAEVFTYRDPAVPGVCYALPRRDRTTGSIELLGIICQSEATGSACFWDNRTPMNSPLTGVDVELQIDQIANGSTLDETCTDCHRGRNAFNIHPGTALDLRTRADVVMTDMPGVPWDTEPAVRFTPVGRAHWVNPPELDLLAVPPEQAPCNSCHEIPSSRPRRVSNYCTSVLDDAARTTMPAFRAPDEPLAGWPVVPGSLVGITNPRYQAHLLTLSYCP
jgi:hypothetical protein